MLEGISSETDQSYLALNAGLGTHSLCIQVSEAHYELSSAIGNRITARLLTFLLSCVLRSDYHRQRDAVHKVVVSERAFGVVRNGLDLRIVLMNKNSIIGVVVGHDDKLETTSWM